MNTELDNVSLYRDSVNKGESKGNFDILSDIKGGDAGDGEKRVRNRHLTK